jgi:hypothetical protein
MVSSVSVPPSGARELPSNIAAGDVLAISLMGWPSVPLVELSGVIRSIGSARSAEPRIPRFKLLRELQANRPTVARCIIEGRDTAPPATRSTVARRVTEGPQFATEMVSPDKRGPDAVSVVRPLP